MKRRYSQVLTRSSLRRPPFSFLLSIFSILLFPVLTLQSCGLDIEDPTPPSPPVWVQKSLPEEWPERGIDAHEFGSIYLEWEFNFNEDIVAYNIYRAQWFGMNDSLGDYNLITQIDLESIPDGEYIDSDVDIRTKYFYKLKSENSSKSMSVYSDSVFYSLLPQLSPAMLRPNGQDRSLGENRMLTWRYSYSIEMEDYCITILTRENELICRTIVLPGNYVYRDESWPIPDEIELQIGEVYKWRIDTGSHYVDGLETVGSESAWATFLYVE